ncbi:MAG: SHOCT domain-containing protein [Actinomycetota bacterium]
MMMWYGTEGTGMWWGIVMTLVMLAFWGGLAAIVAYVVRAGVGRRDERRPEPAQILAERLARGEIDAEEYHARLKVLSAG